MKLNTAKAMTNKHGDVLPGTEEIYSSGARDKDYIAITVRRAGYLMHYEVTPEGKAPDELGPNFDVFNVLTQKEKALEELNSVGDAFVKFPETFKLIQEL